MEDHPAKRRRIEEPEKASQALVAKRRAAGLPSSRYNGVSWYKPTSESESLLDIALQLKLCSSLAEQLPAGHSSWKHSRGGAAAQGIRAAVARLLFLSPSGPSIHIVL